MPSGPGVAIVGAGPAGLVVAHLLQREAIPFVVFERQTLAGLARRPKAGLVEYRTVQLLAREGIAGSILQFTTENHRSSSARRTSRCCCRPGVNDSYFGHVFGAFHRRRLRDEPGLRALRRARPVAGQAGRLRGGFQRVIVLIGGRA